MHLRIRISLIVSFIFIASLRYAACIGDREISIDIQKWEVYTIYRGFTAINIQKLDNSYTSIIFQVTAFKPVCLSTKRECRQNFSYYGKSVGVEKVLFENGNMPISNSVTWFLSSNISQQVFIYAKGYSSAPIIGACPTSPSPLSLNPNIQVNETAFYNLLSFSYSTLLVRNKRRFLLSCSDKSYWPQLVYEVYFIPWNQRFEVSNPSFNRSSLYSFKQAMYRATSMNVLRDGSLIHSETMDKLRKAEIRVFKRLGLDVAISIVVRVKDSQFSTNEGSDDTAFYVSQNILGCGNNGIDCGIAVTIWEMIVVGIFALYGLGYAHLGRRFHRLNTFTSGFAIGSFIVFVIVSRYANFHSGVIESLSIVGGGIGLGVVMMLIFWKVKPSCRTSHIPLYLTASFMILAAVFFTPLGNDRIWNSQNIFFGVFFGLLAALALFVFLPFTKKISVDLCTALIGTYVFLCGVLVIFAPGTVFPYLILDAVYRVAVPGAHNALTIAWTGYVDVCVFIAWPIIVIFFMIFNHYCSPPLEPTSSTYEEPRETTRQPTNWAPVDSWPPLPPDAYVSERTPLLPTANQTARRSSNGSAPPPYTDSVPIDGPPSYRP